jgi:sugar/nucleoside kinase (ribokinase family)
VFRIGVTGHLCLDFYPDLPAAAKLAPGQLFDVGPMRVDLGGCVANTGLALRGFGAQVNLSGSAGDDFLAVILEQLLGDQGRAMRVPGETTSYSVVVEPKGLDRTFWHHNGANAHFDPTRVSIDTDLLHLGYPPMLPNTLTDNGRPLRELFSRAHDAGVTTSVDMIVVDPTSPVAGLDWEAFFRAVLPVTDVISPSADDLASIVGGPGAESLEAAADWCDYLVEHGVAVAMVTAGKHGMALKSADLDRVHSGGRVLAALGPEWDRAALTLPVAPSTGHVTATGAGDAATAGLLQALANGLSPHNAVDLARRTAAERMAGRNPTPALMDAYA